MKKCPYCKTEIKPGIHIYACAKKHGNTKNRNEIKFEFIKFNFPGLTEDFVDKYENKLFSIPDFNNEYGTDNKTITFLVDYFKLHKRSIKESSNLISVEKYKHTCIEKYGQDNVSKVKSVKEKKKNTFINNYGVDNIFKEENFKKWIAENNFAWMYDESNKQRSKSQSVSIKYFWDNVSDERKNEIVNKRNEAIRKSWNDLSEEERTLRVQKLFTYSSRLESRISEILNKNGLSYKTQFFVGRKSYDFLFSNSKILLEVQGDFWHANPEMYNENDLINFPGAKGTKVKDVWKKDKIKKENAESNGYVIFYIWENQMKTMSDDEVFNFIKENIKKFY